MSRDSFVEVRRAFYEAPPEYIGRQVWVRWDSRCVRIFNDRMEQVQIHLRLEPGKFSRILGVAGMSAPVLSSCRWWIGRAALLGEACGQWAQASVDRRGPEALRSIMGLCHLIEKAHGGHHRRRLSESPEGRRPAAQRHPTPHRRTKRTGQLRLRSKSPFDPRPENLLRLHQQAPLTQL